MAQVSTGTVVVAGTSEKAVASPLILAYSQVSTQSIAGATTITSTSATALAVGRQGTTSPVFTVDASTSTNVTGIKITGAASGAAVAVVVTSSATDEALTINAKGSGTISLGATSTGNLLIGTNVTMADAKNVVINATTGTKFGTATTAKIGFFNATPVTQPAANADVSTGAAGGTTAVYLNTTFVGNSGTAAFTLGRLARGEARAVCGVLAGRSRDKPQGSWSVGSVASGRCDQFSPWRMR